MTLPLVDGDGVAVADDDGVAVAAGDGQGVAEALLTAVADGLADAEGDGVGVGVGDGVALLFAVADAEGVGVAAGAQKVGAGVGARSVRLAGAAVLLPPFSSNAAGTTIRPMMTVITKASAPHSWSQKARDELRIRALRPAPAAVCYAY